MVALLSYRLRGVVIGAGVGLFAGGVTTLGTFLIAADTAAVTAGERIL